MKPEEILQNNKLIAEFDGWELAETVRHESMSPSYIKHLNEGNQITALSFIKYHSSWNEIMPVVDKIMLIKRDKFIGAPPSIAIKFDTVLGLSIITPRGILYENIVNFIKWYNNYDKNLQSTNS